MDTNYQCDLCGNQFKGLEEVKKHMVNHAKGSNQARDTEQRPKLKPTLVRNKTCYFQYNTGNQLLYLKEKYTNRKQRITCYEDLIRKRDGTFFDNITGVGAPDTDPEFYLDHPAFNLVSEILRHNKDKIITEQELVSMFRPQKEDRFCRACQLSFKTRDELLKHTHSNEHMQQLKKLSAGHLKLGAAEQQQRTRWKVTKQTTAHSDVSSDEAENVEQPAIAAILSPELQEFPELLNDEPLQQSRGVGYKNPEIEEVKATIDLTVLAEEQKGKGKDPEWCPDFHLKSRKPPKGYLPISDKNLEKLMNSSKGLDIDIVGSSHTRPVFNRLLTNKNIFDLTIDQMINRCRIVARHRTVAFGTMSVQATDN